MTTIEARIILGLRDDDVPTREGLQGLRRMNEEQLARSLDRRGNAKRRREIAAIDKLLYWMDTYGKA